RVAGQPFSLDGQHGGSRGRRTFAGGERRHDARNDQDQQHSPPSRPLGSMGARPSSSDASRSALSATCRRARRYSPQMNSLSLRTAPRTEAAALGATLDFFSALAAARLEQARALVTDDFAWFGRRNLDWQGEAIRRFVHAAPLSASEA